MMKMCNCNIYKCVDLDNQCVEDVNVEKVARIKNVTKISIGKLFDLVIIVFFVKWKVQ